VIATLKEGSQIEIVDLHGDYYRVIVPGEPGKPRVGYVLVQLVELLDEDATSQPMSAIPTPIQRSASQRATMPPTLNQLGLHQDKVAEREKAAKSEVDRLQAELKLLQEPPAARQVRPEPEAVETGFGQEREGFWFNGGLGFGSATCVGCSVSLGGLSGGLSLGGTISDRVILGVGTTGFVGSDLFSTLSIGTIDARLRFYPVRTSGFFMTGGLGVGSVTVDEFSEYGVGVVMGLGWDIRMNRNLSLTPFWNGTAVGRTSGTIGFGQLGLGITIH
jgi:hypothetical protein